MTVRGPEAFFIGSRAWWSAALFLGPIVGGWTGGVVGAVAATVLFVLPTFVVFDTDRSWWSDEVRRLPQNSERTRAELRSLTLTSAVALALGVAVALLGTWR